VTDLTAAIAAVLRDRPPPGDDDHTRADWFDRKAAVFADIADLGGPDADDAQGAADQAQVEARRLRRAAQSPDAHLVLIDPNEVQFGPWRDRALAYASDDPADALAALELVRDEIRARLALLRRLPGVVRKVTRHIAVEHRLPLWLLVVDELAFHTSVVGHPETARRLQRRRPRRRGPMPGGRGHPAHGHTTAHVGRRADLAA